MIFNTRESWKRMVEAMRAIQKVLTDEPQTSVEISRRSGLSLMAAKDALISMHKLGLVRSKLLGKGENLGRRPEGFFRVGNYLAEDQSDLRNRLPERHEANGGEKC